MKISKVQDLLKKGVIQENGDVDVATGDAIIACANELADRLDTYAEERDKNSKKSSYGPRISDFSAILRLISWCYPIQTKQVKSAEVDRLSSMFCGPFFISDEYPWPQQDGKYYEPLVQMDTSIINEVSVVKFEDGIFQLWVDGFLPDEYVIRIIPRNQCTLENLSSVPECIDREYYDEIERTGDAYLAWPANTTVYVFKEKLKQKLSWVSGMEDAFDFMVGEIEDVQLSDDVNGFLSLFPYDKPSTEPHFFGTFSPIQYSPIDVDPTFLALESRPCLSWNYGNAQVSYRVDEQGKVEFDFACSCQ